MIHISYTLQKRINRWTINILMIIFLTFTLFPIVWMMYSSIKENNDILLGKIGLSKSENNVIALEKKGDTLYVCSSDGGISTFRGTQRLDSTSITTFATDFIFDDRYIWVSSGDKDIVRIDQKDLREQKKFEHHLNLDMTKIAGTHIIDSGNKLYLGIDYKGFENIMEFNKDKEVYERKIPLTCELSPLLILSLAQSGDILWVGTDRGLIKMDLPSGKIKKTFSWQTGFIPYKIERLKVLDDHLFIGTAAGLFSMDMRNDQLVKYSDKASGMPTSQIYSITTYKDLIFAGTSGGLSIIDQKTGKVKSFENIFRPIGDEGKLEPAEVLAVLADADTLFVGSSKGRVTEIKNNAPKEFIWGREGHLIVAWRNYVDLWKNIDFGLFLRNSFFICAATMIISMMFATTAAYAISRFNFPGNRFMSTSILATQMVPMTMYLIPIYLTFIQLTNLTGIPIKGTFWGIIFIYSAFFTPFSIWILRSFFVAIPLELEEAARIDGCSPWQVFWKITLPLAIPGVVATGVYIFLTAWDELVFAWVLTNADTQTIPVGIRLFVGNYQNRFDLMMAAATIATVPVMILFFMLQKQIVKGLTAGAVKG